MKKGILKQGTFFEENYLQRTHKTLTSNPEVALTELVANAWDAGATKVEITIPAKTGQLLTIKDNGVGMTLDEFSERWMRLSYNRLAHQGKKVEFPLGVKGFRQAFGRNGVGRHGLLCFNNWYTVVTTKEGSQHTLTIDSTEKEPIHIKNYTSKKVDEAEHGLTLKAVVQERRPDADKILEELSARFVTDPSFSIFINRKKVEPMDLSGLIESSKEIVIGGKVRIKILFIDTAVSHRKSVYQGIAFWQAGRLVGEPSWMLGGTAVLDGRTTNAKKCTFIVQSKDLGDYVKEDWTGFIESDMMNEVYARVRKYVIAALGHYNQTHIEDIKTAIKDSYKTQLGALTALGRCEVDETIEHITKTRPTASRDSIEIAVDAVVNLSKARSGDALMKKLAALDPSEVDALNELLSKWSVKDAMVVLEEIDRRISIVEAISKLSQDNKTDELHTLHPLITESRWIFGPEYESQEYASNRQLQTIAKKFFNSDNAKFLNPKKRPDLFVVADLVYSLTGLEEFGENGVSSLRKILIVELKKGGFDIKREERDQAFHYVEDIVQSGLVDPNVDVRAYVVGNTIDKSVSRESKVINNAYVYPVMFSQLVDTARKRLFKLREMLNSRYDDVPGFKLYQRVTQDDFNMAK